MLVVILQHYEFNCRQEDESGILAERFSAGMGGVIYKLERKKEYSKALDASTVHLKLFEKYGYDEVSSSPGTFSFINCWYGCERTPTGNTEFLRVYTHSPQFFIEVVGYTKFHVKSHFEIPEKGLISFTLNHGGLEQRNEKVWLTKVEEVQKGKAKKKTIEDSVGELLK